MKLKVKTLLFLGMVLLVLSGSIGYYSIYQLNNIGEKLVGEQALSIVKTLSYQIDGDKFEKIAADKERDNTYIDGVNDLIRSVKKDTGCTFIYAFSKVSEKEYEYIFSDDEETGTLEDISIYDDIFKNSMNNGTVGYTAVQDDPEYGPMLSAVLPIKNSSGKIVGILACDFLATSIESKVASVKMGITLIVFVLLFISGILTYVFAINITKAIGRNVNLLKKLSEGELNVQGDDRDLRRRDEIGDIVNATIYLKNTFTDIITQVNQTAGSLLATSEELEQVSEQTVTTTEEIENAVEDVAAGAMSQAESTQEASRQTVIMGENIEKTSKSVQQLHMNADKMKETGMVAMNTLNELNDINEKTKQEIDTIYRQTNETNDFALKIQKAAEIITSIAEETNLLSLNASIEAARAGEAGRGFAVVADQIKKLAEQSGQSAKEIGTVIHTLIENSNSAVVTMHGVKGTIEIQNEHLNRTKGNFMTVYEGINRSTDQIEQIAVITEELNNVRITVVDIIGNLSAISEENAASTEETSASTAQLATAVNDVSSEISVLRKLSDELVGVIKVFKM